MSRYDIRNLAPRAGARLAAAGIAAAAALALGSAVPASAAAAGTGDLYGYVVAGSTYTTVSAGWTVPTVHCTSSTADLAIWTGLDGYNSPTIEQTGVEPACVRGAADYYGWYDLYPAGPVSFSNTVKPGDAMAASVTADGSTFTVKLSDSTQGWSKAVHASLAGADL